MEENVLSSLKGRIVQVYKGGPESKKGKLLEITPDYLIIQIEEGVVVYYKLHHVKSVIEDAKFTSDHQAFDKELLSDFIVTNSFKNLLVSLQSKNVQIDRGGPESVTGVLLKAKPDFLVINTVKDGILYYNTMHIKSISIAKETPDSDQLKDTNTGYFKGTNFESLFSQLRNRWVSINRGGPEAIEGILSECSKRYIFVVNGEKITRVNKFHIRNVNLGTKDFSKNNKQDKSEEDNEENKGNKDNRDNKDRKDNKDSKDSKDNKEEKNNNKTKKRFRYSNFHNKYNNRFNHSQKSHSKMSCVCNLDHTDKKDASNKKDNTENRHKKTNHTSFDDIFSEISTNSTRTVWTLDLDD